MADYKAPLRDMRFVLNEVFDVSKLWAELPGLAEVVDADTAAAILEEAGKVSGGTIAPLNRSGDEEGCSWVDGAVATPPIRSAASELARRSTNHFLLCP